MGILRDSLGASKKEVRANIKSKAFAAKLSALEAEKKEIAKKNKGGSHFYSLQPNSKNYGLGITASECVWFIT